MVSRLLHRATKFNLIVELIILLVVNGYLAQLIDYLFYLQKGFSDEGILVSLLVDRLMYL